MYTTCINVLGGGGGGNLVGRTFRQGTLSKKYNYSDKCFHITSDYRQNDFDHKLFDKGFSL